jgi:hypothetical protein
LLGTYDDFPQIHHGTARFSYSVSTIELQRAILNCLLGLNENTDGLDLPELTKQNIRVEMEAGVADGLTFSSLDRDILSQCLMLASRSGFKTLDFFLVVRYYHVEATAKTPLKFDYYIVRFIFGQEELEILVHHERGTRRLAVKEFIAFQIHRINHVLKATKKARLRMIDVRAV